MNKKYLLGLGLGSSLVFLSNSIRSGDIVGIILAGIASVCFIVSGITKWREEKAERREQLERIRENYRTHPNASLSYIMPLFGVSSQEGFYNLLDDVWSLTPAEKQSLNSHINEVIEEYSGEQMDEQVDEQILYWDKQDGVVVLLPEYYEFYEYVDGLLKELLAKRIE